MAWIITREVNTHEVGVQVIIEVDTTTTLEHIIKILLVTNFGVTDLNHLISTITTFEFETIKMVRYEDEVIGVITHVFRHILLVAHECVISDW